MTPLELVLFGAACYLFGLVSGATVIPWLVDRGLFPVHWHDRWSPSTRVPLGETGLGGTVRCFIWQVSRSVQSITFSP
jgi:hypothetical protein